MTGRTGIVAAAVLFIAATGAQAQLTSAQQSALKSNCRSDFMSHCSGVSPGGKDALMCLQKNVASLSPGCQTAVKATIPPPAAAAPPPPPAPAAAAAPPASPPPPAAAAPPPPETAAPPPKAAVTAPPRPAAKPAPAAMVPAAMAPATPTAEQQSAMRASCRNDFMAKCSGVQPGGRDALACLQKNVSTLSPSCKQVVASTMGGAPASAPAAMTPPPPAAIPMGRIENLSIRAKAQIARACTADQDAVCPNVARGGGRVIACLAAHQPSLSPRCRATLAQALQ